MRNRTEELLDQGLNREADASGLIVCLGIERVAQEIVDQVVAEYLARDRFQRRRLAQQHRGYRNGYELERLRTAGEEILEQAPEVRDVPQTYRSRLMGFLRDNSDVLQ
jgi:hypothetical protein